MRSLNSLKNTIVSIIMSVISVLVTFISQDIFLKILGEEYLGLNGLFGNILSVLAIAELGFGTAIIYNMYAPLAHKDNETLKSLMKFYKKVYTIIASIVFIIGIAIIPFLGILIGETTIEANIPFFYLLYLFDSVASYLLSYKRSILYASEQNSYVNIVHIVYLILVNATQIAILLTAKNYIAYLIIKIIFRILENIVISVIANKKFPFIKEKNVMPLPTEIKGNISKNVHGLLYHKICATVINSSNVMIISSFLGISTLGYYTNYMTLITGVNILITQIFNTLTASVGNLLLENDKEKSYNIFKSIKLLNFWIYSFAAIGLVSLAEPFITLWIGEEYILTFSLLLVLSIDLYFSGMKKSYSLFKDAAGIFYEDRFIAIIEPILNVVLSIGLLKIMGINGVVLGTILSSLILFLYDYPKYVYKRLFSKNYFTLIKEDLKLLIIFLITFFTMAIINSHIILTNTWTTITVRLILVLFIPNLIYLLIFHTKDEFQYYLTVFKVLKDKLFAKNK